MKKYFLILFLWPPIFCYSQIKIDTIIKVNDANLYFQVIKGEGTPIVMLSGAGDTSSKWGKIPETIHRLTGTPIITYDIAGTGKSSFIESRLSNPKTYLHNAVEDLEISLKALGYDEEIIMVPHSFGGFITKLFASRNPEKVKYVVRIDGILADFYDKEYLEQIQKIPVSKNKVDPGFYYWTQSMYETIEYMKKIQFPKSIPVINLVATKNTYPFPNRIWNRMQNAQKEFVAEAPNRIQIYAKDSDHYIYEDDPALVIHMVVKAFVDSTTDNQEELEALNKILYKAIKISID